MRHPSLACLGCLVALAACPPAPQPDGGNDVDSGVAVPCDSSKDCKAAAFPGVCRQNVCTAHVPCADDLECGLGEACIDRECAFIGCIADGDCPTGRCRTESFTCAECGTDADCPFNRPICQASTQKCVQCLDDSQCAQPGPAHCEALSGACLHCLTDDHCPNGLKCSGGTCTGALAGQMCPTGTACAAGLTCVNLGMVPTCLQGCDAFAPQCPTGQICYTLKYANSSSFVFDMGGLLGVCYTPVANARNYRDSCQLSAGGSNCQPSLACVPDSSQGATCRAYCDPGALGACPSPEICHHFPGDFYGREYGICYPDNGYGSVCTSDGRCRSGQSCQPYPDPSTFEELSPYCQFNVGAAPGLAPCGSGKGLDGGLTTPDRVCQSGSCRGDTSPQTGPYFCFSACAVDDDCSIAGRTGSCDTDFPFIAPDGVTTAYITGCRPGCQSSQGCTDYASDGGFICRVRLDVTADRSGLKLNCGRPNDGGVGAGSPCTVNGQCTSGYCWLDDARGVRRAGICLEPCQSAADCAASANAGLSSGPLDCQPTTFLGYRGPDFRPGTPDDVLSVRRVCSGIACTKDEDCSLDGGARCVPDVSPFDAGGEVLRCRPPVASANLEADVACSVDSDCASGACGMLANGTRVCFRACDALLPSACPVGLTCRAQAFRFTATRGDTVLLDGCAP
jgi:hypothetical protein